MLSLSSASISGDNADNLTDIAPQYSNAVSESPAAAAGGASDASDASSEGVMHTVGTVVVGALLLLLIAVSISGNILVCIAVGTDQRLRK